MEKVYMVVEKIEKPSELLSFKGTSPARYAYSFHLSPHPRDVAAGKTIIDVPITTEARRSLESSVREPSYFFGDASVHFSSQPRTLLFDTFFPFLAFDYVRRKKKVNVDVRGKGIGTAISLAIASHLKESHPGFTLYFPAKMKSEARRFCRQIGIKPRDSITVEDFFERMQNFHGNSELRKSTKSRWSRAVARIKVALNRGRIAK